MQNLPASPIIRTLYSGIAAFGMIPMIAEAEDWPRWRGTNANGIANEKSWASTWPPAGPVKLWQANVGIGFSSLAVANGRVFVMGNQSNQDIVTCLDAESGQKKWSHPYAAQIEPNLYEGGPNATPTVDGNSVFTLSRRGQLFCFDATSGKVAWSKNIAQEVGGQVPQWGISGSPLVVSNLVILNVGSSGTAVDKATGRTVWKTSGAGGYATPVPFPMGARTAVAILSAKALVAVDPATGRQLWSYPWETSYDVNAADPVFVNGHFFISTGYGRGCTLINVATGRPTRVWENRNMRNHFNPSVIVGDSIYGIDGNTNERPMLKCLDVRTGAVRWTQDGVGAGSVIAADGKLIVLSATGQLMVAPASAAGFRPTGRVQALGGKCWTAPAIANGRIYARNARGDVVCYDVKG